LPEESLLVNPFSRFNATSISVQQAKALSAEVANLPKVHAVDKAFDREKSGALKLRVRQFWREKGKV
jgi:hypothetical protein